MSTDQPCRRRCLGRSPLHSRRRSRQRIDRSGVWRWSDRGGDGRGLLQYGHNRLSGNPDRSLLCRANHHFHLSPHRQHRRKPGRHRDIQSRARRRAFAAAFLHAPITDPSNYRSAQSLDRWLTSRGIIGVTGVDTRALTMLIREKRHAERRDRAQSRWRLRFRCAARHGSRLSEHGGRRTRSKRHVRAKLPVERKGLGMEPRLRRAGKPRVPRRRHRLWHQAQHPALSRLGGMPGDRASRRTPRAQEILGRKPDGVFLSNGPGDPAATGEYAIPVIRKSHQLWRAAVSASASATNFWGSRWAAAR